MQQKQPCRRCGMGRLPAKAPMAYPYVPFQRECPDKYDPRKALVRGTLYTDLDLPFQGMVNRRELAVTPLTELQALAFTLQELALYLDTHRDDAAALEHYKKVQALYTDARRCYEKKYGSLNRMSEMGCEYTWLNDPWPWEYAKNRGV